MATRITKAREQALLTALAFGATVENAARKAGVSERAAYYRLRDSAFRARIDAMRQETLLRTAGMLTGASLGAVKTLVDLQNDATAPPAVRRVAAHDVLAFNVTYRESAEIEQRVSALEERLARPR
jgi:hypothetical protein